MLNPWLHLPRKAPFVLEEEREIIDAFNRNYPDPQTRIRVDVLPEPFIGNPYANVVILSLNPGFDETDLEWHAKADFSASIYANLRHESQLYPFYPLTPDFSRSGAYAWWRKKLNDLIYATSLSAVANNLFCVEWFPYHSVTYRAVPKRLSGGVMPSQRYAGALVQAAIERGAQIIAMRRYRDWEQLLPSLREYPDVHHLRSAQSAYLSRGNLIGFSRVVEALKKSQS
jgi:hypothetical protein